MSIAYSIVIPTYNAPNLRLLLDELNVFFLNKGTYEIIIINDGGLSLSLTEPVILLEFEKNRGKNYALFEGLKIAQGQRIITLDDDGQHPVLEIEKLISKENHDVVVGQYQSENGVQSVIKHWTEIVLFGKKKDIRFTPFKLFKRAILKLDSFNNRVPFVSVLLMESTKDIVGIEVQVNELLNQKTRFSFVKKVRFYRSLVASKNSFFRMLMGF